MKQMFAVCMAAVLAFGMVGCGNGGTQTGQTGESVEGANGAEGSLEPVSIVLDWYPNALHTFLYAADAQGYFAEEGLALDVQFPSNPNDAISLPAAGKADFGLYYLQDVILTAVEEDVPIVSVGALAQHSLNVVISKEEANIETAADLAGKKIGYAGSTLAEAQVACMLETAGLSAEDCTLVDVGFDLLTALTTGQVDATIGNMVNHEVPQLEAEGIAIRYFYPTAYGVPQYYEPVCLTGEKTLAEEPEKVEAFLRACEKGYAYTKAHPEEALQSLLDAQDVANFPLDAEVERQGLAYVLEAMEAGDGGFLEQDVAVWQENADWLYERGILGEPRDVAFLVK